MIGRNEREPPQIVTITPQQAMEMLEHNMCNRPLNDQHVHRLARQIVTGKWKFGTSIR